MGAAFPPTGPSARTDRIDALVQDGRGLETWPDAMQHAYRGEQRQRLLQEGRFHLTLGLLVCFATLLVDLTVIPHKTGEGAALRGLTVAPLVLAGLAAVARGKARLVAFCIGASITAFAAVMLFLSAAMPDIIAARILVGVALLPSLAGAVLPLPPRSLLRLFLAYSAAILSCTALFVPGGLGAHPDVIAILILAQAGIYQIALRHESLRQRNFLLAQKGRASTEELVEANRMLRRLSERDPLTGLPNRRHFAATFERRFAAVEDAGGDRIALMMIDLDRFKAFNDRHGHQAGDECLRLVGNAMQAELRKGEVAFARYGGEEFIAALRERNPGDAEAMAARLCRAVSSLPGRVADVPLVTTSIGVAIAPMADGLSREELVEMADAALYAAKNAGRNRYEIVEAGALPDRLSA